MKPYPPAPQPFSHEATGLTLEPDGSTSDRSFHEQHLGYDAAQDQAAMADWRAQEAELSQVRVYELLRTNPTDGVVALKDLCERFPDRPEVVEWQTLIEKFSQV